MEGSIPSANIFDLWRNSLMYVVKVVSRSESVVDESGRGSGCSGGADLIVQRDGTTIFQGHDIEAFANFLQTEFQMKKVNIKETYSEVWT
jgi:hypothetical protein